MKFILLFIISLNALANPSVITNKNAVIKISELQDKDKRTNEDNKDIKKAVKQLATGWTPKQ